MTLQNRVTPAGEIVSAPARGLMMGNRGCLHGLGRELGVSRWRSRLWICCVLDWKDVRRDPMPPGRWTALFFLDEATALAAGHRPCGYCRRADYLDFARAWQAARFLPVRPRAFEMDAILHADRVDRSRRQRTHVRPAGELPDGVMIRHGSAAALLVAGTPREWSFAGYRGPATCLPGDEPVEVLTPPSVVAAIEAGYRPMVHPSALPPGQGSRPSAVRIQPPRSGRLSESWSQSSVSGVSGGPVSSQL
jgi:hypothetical protein